MKDNVKERQENNLTGLDIVYAFEKHKHDQGEEKREHNISNISRSQCSIYDK